MNSFFIDITNKSEQKEDNESNANTLEDVLEAFSFHPSIEKIRRIVKTNKKFYFNQYQKIWYLKSFRT